MENRYLFRGKRNGEWIIGSVTILPNGSATITKYICDMQYQVLKVDPATIGQCTGLKDKNGKLIFEGDCLGCNLNVVEFIDGVYCINGDRLLFTMNKNNEIVGNIHDK